MAQITQNKTEKKQATDILADLNKIGTVCDRTTGKEYIPLPDLIEAVLKLAEALAEITLYDYQRVFARRVVEAIFMREADMLTALMSRQSGKTSVIGAITCACMVIIPELAKQFPDDWRFNLTDSLGRYRGYKHGIDFGIYAPILDQAQTMFERIRLYFDTASAKTILQELKIVHTANRGNRVSLSNGSVVVAMSASKTSMIEGHTHHVLLLEEAQGIDTMVVRKSLHPMVASLKGLIVKIGTASTQKGDFYYAIQTNLRMAAISGKQNHFFFPYEVCIKYNSLYNDYVQAEKVRIGEDSDEFRMSYKCEWLLERGMFLVPKTLMSNKVATTHGKYSQFYQNGYVAPYLVAGIDLGKESDSTIVTIMEAEWDEPALHEIITRNMKEEEFIAYNKHIIGWKEWHGDDYEYQFQEIVAWLKKFRMLRKIVLDSTREASFSDRLAHHPDFELVEFEPFIFSVQTKAAGYRLLHGDILAGRVTFPAGQETRKTVEYRKFVQQSLDLVKSYTGGFLSVSHPDETGAHDDYPDSWMLANWGSNKPAMDKQAESFSGNMFI